MLRFFESLVDPFPREQPTQPPATLYAFCRHYMQGMERYLLLLAITTALIAVGEAMLYGVLGKVVDWLSSASPDHFFEQQWLAMLGMSLFVLVFIPLIVLLHSLLLHQSLMGNFPMRVRWRSHRYLLTQSYSFFQHEFSGRIATKVMQSALAVRETVIKLLDVMLFVVVYLVTTVLLIAHADIRLVVPLLLWVAIYAGLLRYFIPRLQAVAEHQADARSVMTGRIVDSYTNILTLKLFSHHRREEEYIREGMTDFLGTVYPQMRLVTGLNVSVWTLNMLLLFATTATGIALWMHGHITPGAIAIAISIAIRIVGMSQWIMWEVSSLFENIGTVQDSLNTLSLPRAIVDKPGAHALQVKQGEIAFRNVSFAYHPEAPVFEKLNLVIKPGEKVGIVGRSGAGKSTLVNLMLRFYDVQQGSITIDGENITAVTQESLRSHIAMVSQDTALLHRSVRENICFGKPDASEDQMHAAAQQAQADAFIAALHDIKNRRGYDAHVGERGVTLSGGQRQRIAIARVLLKDAPILILDEATSALDSEAEAAIQKNLYKLMQGKTVIAIAHRLSTIAAMDRLVVMDSGKIIEEGSHQELLQRDGLYAQLWKRQSGGLIACD